MKTIPSKNCMPCLIKCPVADASYSASASPLTTKIKARGCAILLRKHEAYSESVYMIGLSVCLSVRGRMRAESNIRQNYSLRGAVK